MDEADWARLVDQLGKGRCTPFLGAGACDGTLLASAGLSRKWAAAYKYPFTDDGDLARVMQFAADSVGDPVDLKQMVCDDIASADPPNFSDLEEPHALLAGFQIPVFVTTNYDNFLAQALEQKGKDPNPVTCSWYKDNSRAVDTMSGLVPTAGNPLIYHLHGSMQDPQSLVLTEDDYLEFLIKISNSYTDEKLRIIPTAVTSALTDNPMLFIGYSLKDWTFRVLFHGLLRSVAPSNRRHSVSVQLLPDLSHSIAEAEELALAFMTSYFANWKISVYWGTAPAFCQELRQRMGTPK